MSTMTMYDYFSLEWRDMVVDLVDELHVNLLQYMSVQEADLCWNYLEEHYFYNNHYGEA